MALQIAAEAGVKKFVKNYIHIIGSNDQYVYGGAYSDSKE